MSAPRAAALVLAVALAGCESEEESHELALERTLDLTLAEYTEMAGHPQQFHDELNKVRELKAHFPPVSKTDLEALAGPDAKVEWQPGPFYSLLQIRAPGTKHQAVQLFTSAAAKGERVHPAGLTLLDKGFTASLLFIDVPGPPVAKPGGAAASPLGPKGAFCMASCRERRERIVRKQAELVALEASVGELQSYRREKKELEDLLHIQKDVPSSAWLPVLQRLDEADWFAPGSRLTMNKSDGTLGQAGPPPEPAEQQSRVDACDRSLAPLASCRWDPKLSLLGIELKPAPPP